jgi:1-deoxy-D-xylulose-5-phosphate reductoisomerase
VECGAEALAAAASGDNVQVVMAAIVGARPQVHLGRRACGKRVLLAQGGSGHGRDASSWTKCAARASEIIPIDSEHNAIFQCMPGGYLPGDVAAA